MRRRFAVLAALPLVLAGCSAATLRNAETGKTLAIMQASELGCIRTGAATGWIFSARR